MRIALLMLPMIALTACSTAQPLDEPAKARPSLKVAEAACFRKGYSHNTFEFAECYDNRPEVQAFARDQRISKMSIINDNRSTRTVAQRSYPVE